MNAAYAGKVYLDNISGNVLDSFLEAGWFRNGNRIFTTQFLQFKGITYDAVWLRIVLDDFKLTPSQQELFLKNSRFTYKIRKFKLNEARENLFQKYKEASHFPMSPSLSYLLLDHELRHVYNTYEIGLYDGIDLIGLGIFDLGSKSAAGISCIFDPAYKKFSLGRYLMLLKMQELKQRGFHSFYPGYFAPGYTMFDYKLKLNKKNTEYYHPISKSWKAIASFDAQHTLLAEMRSKLLNLATHLKERGITLTLWHYPYFDAVLHPGFLSEFELQDPVFLLIKDYRNENDYVLLITYDPIRSCFKILESYIIGFPAIPIEGQNIYGKAVLEVCDVLLEFDTINEKMIKDVKNLM